MCDYIFLPPDVISQMKQLYPKNLPKDYFIQFEALTKKYALQNKDKHRVEKIKIKGRNGLHDLIYGRLEDAEAVLPSFQYSFSCIL